MLTPIYKKKFERDLKRVSKRGKSIEKIKTVMRRLIEEKTLEAKYCDHPLRGKHVDTRECHIEPDWLLIYMLQNNSRFLHLMAVPLRRPTAIKLSNLSSGDGLITESREVPLSWIPRTSRGTT